MNKNILFTRAGASFGAFVLASSALAGPVFGQDAAQAAPVVSASVAVNAPLVGLDQAQQILEARQWFRAAEVYARLVNAQSDEERGQARFGLALALSQLGQEDKAIETLEGTLADGSPLGQAVGELRGRLMLQLAEKALAEQQPGAATQWLDRYDRLVAKPDRPRAERLRAAMEQVTGTAPDTPTMVLRVGVMLPLDGELKPVGDDVLRGVQLGLKDFDGRRGTRVEMLPMNVTDAASAKAAATEMLAQGVQVVVGPLTRAAADGAKEVLAGKHVPLLVFSSDRSVLGGGVHALSYLPAEQARMAARAAYGRGKSKAAGLVPGTPYGYEVYDAFQDEFKRLGGEVVGNAFYTPGTNDLSANIRTLVGAVEGSKKSFSRAFDTLFVPAPGPALPLVTSQLSYYDVDKIDSNGDKTLLLGTGLWQDPATLSSAAAGVKGGVFAVPAKADSFVQEYKEAFEAEPHPLAVLGYDAMRVLVDVAAEKQRTAKGVEELLLRPEGFYGSGGYLRFKDTGVTERGLNVVKVGSQFEVEEEALTLTPLEMPGNARPSGRGGRGWW